MRHLVYLSVVAFLVTLIVTPVFAEGLPASKANARVTEMIVIQCGVDAPPAGTPAAMCTGWHPIVSFPIKPTGNKKDLLVGLSAVTLVTTLNKVSSKGGKKSTVEAGAGVMARIVLTDLDSSSYTTCAPGEIVFDRRLVELSATLEGQIADCLTVCTPADVLAGLCLIPGVDIILDESCVIPEVIELLQESESAHHFNFWCSNVSPGEYMLEAQMIVTRVANENDECLGLEEEDCVADATVFVGPLSLTAEVVRTVDRNNPIEF
jgi:hypothetical protein